MKALVIMAAVGLALRPPLAVADDDEVVDVNDLALEELLALEVTTATRIDQPIALAPATVSVLGREQMRDYGWASLSEVLWSLPGTVRSHDYERRLVSSRGSYHPWNHNRLLLQLDGVSVNDPETGAAWTWEVLPLFLAERAEILRGSGSALYGGHAVLGVVSLETIAPDSLGRYHSESRVALGQRSVAVDALATADDPATGGFVAGAQIISTAGDEYRIADGSGRTDADGALSRFTTQDQRRSVALMLKWVGHRRFAGVTLEALHQDYSTELGLGWWDWAEDAPQQVVDRQTIVSVHHDWQRGRVHLRSAAQLQRRGYSAQLRTLPAGAFDGAYPDGIDESIRTSFDKVTATSHAIVALPRAATAIVGAEYARTAYRGDDVHTVSVDPDDPELAPIGESRPTAGVYEPMAGLPMHALAGFGQVSTGRWLGRRFEITAGARADLLAYRFRAEPEAAVQHGSYHRLSPRLAAVARVTDTLTAKVMVATAFRLPTAIELFASHSLTAAGTPMGLEAETERTYEVATDWAPVPAIRVRTNAFVVEDDNLIDYEGSDGRLHNLYDNRRLGFEGEVTFAVARGPWQVDGWASYAYTRLLDEHVQSDELTEEHRLTWVPAQVAKVGVRVRRGTWGATVQAYGQGRTFRRQTDLATAAFRAQRPDVVPGWGDVDVTAWRELGPVRLGLRVTGLLDSRAPIPATRDVGYDNRLEPREVFATVGLRL